MNDDDLNPSVAPLNPEPLTDEQQRLMIATELSVIRGLLEVDAFTVAGMQQINRGLVLQAGPITPADAAMTPLREQVLIELHDKLALATGITDLDYWQQPHRPDVPDDLSGLEP